MAIKHLKVLTGPDGPDTAAVRPSDWNAPLVIEDGTITAQHVAAVNKDGSAATASMRTLGTSATQACAGNDSRLSDARAPTAHNHDASYASLGHNHDSAYSAAGHNHTGVYATAAHNHDATYSLLGHTHPGGGTATGVFSDLQLSVLQAAHTLAAAAGVQSVFPAAQDAFTVAANSTYRVTGRYILATGATTHTTAMAWALSGATVASFEYTTNLWSAAANTISTAQSSCHVTGVASKVLNATSTAVRTIIEFDGILVTTLGGTITPQINFSANPTGTNQTLRGSYVSFELIGSDVATKFGGWA
jgi:hypothetical protein